jgi:glycosyltransferase involved in cell wall biosynthesis
MKILRVIARLNIGGPARHVLLLDRGLRALGHDTLLVHGSVDAGEGELEHLAAQYGVPTLKMAALGRRISVWNDLQAFLQLTRLVFREAPDVVHTHTAKAGALGRLAAFAFNLTRPRGRRCLVVHTFHGHVLTGYFRPSVNLVLRLTERCLAAMTDRIITVSTRQRDDIVSRFRIAPEGRVEVVPLGLDLQPLLCQPATTSRLRHDLGIPADDIVVGYVGRFVPIKNLGMLVRAFGIAARTEPTLRLLLVGDGPARGETQELARQGGIDRRVRFLGWCEDLPGVYGAMDLCALTSFNEGTPVSLIEAMAAGKTVVATAVGGVPDLVVDGQTGFLVQPGDAESLAGIVIRLARDPAERSCVGERARADVSARYSHERLVADIERLYRSALARKRAASAPETSQF